MGVALDDVTGIVPSAASCKALAKVVACAIEGGA